MSTLISTISNWRHICLGMEWNTKVFTSYHPQSSIQDEVSNREIESILAKTANFYHTDWSKNHDDDLWSYWITFESYFGMFPCKLVFVKAYHLPYELENKALWALKKVNLNWEVAAKNLCRSTTYIEWVSVTGIWDLYSA